MNGVVQARKRGTYWLLTRDGFNGPDILSTRLSYGRQALAVFSFEEEAEMFLRLRGRADGWQARETTAGEMLSLFYTVLKEIICVTLDPIPENSFLNASGILSISREHFIERLESIITKKQFSGTEALAPDGNGYGHSSTNLSDPTLHQN